jgi:hypothetical protein
MTVKDRVKWYCVVSALVFLSLSIYKGTVYVYSNLELDRILGYSKYTAGFSALAFALLYWAKPQSMRLSVGWYGVISACVFLVVSTYMQTTVAFYDVTLPRALTSLEFVSALAALIFGLLSFPKWQSYFALAVWAFSFYRFSQPAFGIA